MSSSHAGTWPSDAPTPGQWSEFLEQIKMGRITKHNLQEFLRTGNVNSDAALHGGIIHPKEIASKIDTFVYSPERLRYFDGTLDNTIKRAQIGGGAVGIVAGPPEKVCLDDLNAIPMHFLYEDNLHNVSLNNETVPSRWIGLSFVWGPILNDPKFRRFYQVANVAEVLWFLWFWNRRDGIQHMPGGPHRLITSSRVSHGHHVCVHVHAGKIPVLGNIRDDERWSADLADLWTAYVLAMDAVE